MSIELAQSSILALTSVVTNTRQCLLLTHPNCYRPQRSCSKVMFSQASVFLFTGMLGYTPSTPPREAHTLPPGSTPPGKHTPSLPRKAHPPKAHTLPPKHTPRRPSAANGTHPTGMLYCFDIDLHCFRGHKSVDYSKFGGDASDDDGLFNSSFQLSHLFSHHEFERFFVNFKTCNLQHLITQCKYNSQTKFGEGNIFTDVCLSTGGWRVGNIKYLMA